MVLTPVSFNYGGKKARDIGLICRCHLSNIMPDSILYDGMGWGMTQFVFLFFCLFDFVFFLFLFFFRGGNRCLSQHRRDRFSLITIAPLGVGKP